MSKSASLRALDTRYGGGQECGNSTSVFAGSILVVDLRAVRQCCQSFRSVPPSPSGVSHDGYCSGGDGAQRYQTQGRGDSHFYGRGATWGQQATKNADRNELTISL